MGAILDDPEFDLGHAIDEAADKLKWCLLDRYRADGETVLKGGNEHVNFYCLGTPEQAQHIAESLESVVAPIRRANALKLLDEIDRLSMQLRTVLV